MTRSQMELQSGAPHENRVEPRVTNQQTIHVPDHAGMRPLLFLGFLAACAPTALMFVLGAGDNSVWYGPVAHTVLNACTSVLQAIVAYWLAREAKLGSYPVVAVLSGGFFGLAAVF